MYKKYIMQKKLGLIAQLLPKIGFKHFTAAYRGSPPPAVFHNQIKKTQQGNLLLKTDKGNSATHL